MEPILNPTQIRPWWLRLGLLAFLGSPMILSKVLHGGLHEAHFFSDLGKWTAYAVFIWLFVVLCAGLKRFIDWLSVASLFGLTVMFSGALLRKAGVWLLLEKALMGVHTSAEQQVMDLFFRFIVILVSYPFALLMINSFPAADIMRWVSRRSATRAGSTAVVVAMFIRMLQVVSEVVTRAMLAWKEENPAVVLARFRADWMGSPFHRVAILQWARLAISAWCGVIAIQTFETVPVIVRDFRRMRGAVDSSTEVLHVR